MQSGRLRHVITLQRPHRAKADDGEMVETFVDVARVPAEVMELKGAEYIQSREKHAEITVRIYIRYFDGIRPTWRAKFGDRTLEIKHAIDQQGRRRQHELLCLEVVT